MHFARSAVFAQDVSFDAGCLERYDLLVVALGYESRARFIASRLGVVADDRVAIPFASDRVLAYEDNRKYLGENAFEFTDANETVYVPQLRQHISLVVTRAERARRAVRMCVDISSLTRQKMARVLEEILGAPGEVPVEVDFAYAIAAFSPPPAREEAASVCGPVSSFFAGWPSDPDRPIAAIVGLGYELERALGALEYLEPSKQMLLRPVSRDARFDGHVSSANAGLLLDVGEVNTFSYPIDKPTQTLEVLQALFFANRDHYRVMLVPFGPKIFALCCLIAACRHYPEIAVWRVSPGASTVPVDHKASGTVVVLRVRFERRDKAGDRHQA